MERMHSGFIWCDEATMVDPLVQCKQSIAKKVKESGAFGFWWSLVLKEECVTCLPVGALKQGMLGHQMGLSRGTQDPSQRDFALDTLFLEVKVSTGAIEAFGNRNQQNGQQCNVVAAVGAVAVAR
jgi:hypothetical protein